MKTQAPDTEPFAAVAWRAWRLRLPDHGVKVMVVAPAATVDLAMRSGAAIPIEQRAPHEVTAIHGGPLAPAGVMAEHPAFDVTPAALVDALVSERGVVARPDPAKMRAVFGAETPPG